MNIKEITITNFRSYYKKNTVKFNDGLVLFVGDNGDGKTTFFEALEWLFDTSTQNKDRRLISEKRISELPENENDILSVSMTFDHDGEKIVEKSFSFKKSGNDIFIDDFQFKGWDNSGTERVPIRGDKLLDRCFDAAIRKYCLFKGEENLNVFNDPKALDFLIETFSNIQQFKPYYTGDENNPGFTDYAEDLSRKAYENAMKAEKKKSQQEKELRSELDSFRTKLSNVKQKLKTNRENFSNYSSLLEGIENSKEASSLLRTINERLKSLNEKKSKHEDRIDDNYTIKLLDESWILCGFSQFLKKYQEKVNIFSKEKRKLEDEDKKQKGKEEAYKEVSKSLAKGIIPLSIYVPDENTMQEMIEDKICKVCGREAEEGSDAYNFMVDKLNELLKSQQPKKTKEKPLFKNNFVKEFEQKSISLGYNQEELNNLKNKIEENVKFNKACKIEIKKIQEAIDAEEESKKKLLAQNGNFTEEELQNAYENIKYWYDGKNEAQKQIYDLEKTEKEVEIVLKETQEKYDKLAEKTAANTIRKIHTVFNKIQDAFKQAKIKNTNDFLVDLEEKSNLYLEKLNDKGFFGIIHISKTPEGSVSIVLEDKNGTFITSPNQALKTTMYMSVLFAVSELTTIKRENDYPLIFDAPTSSFAPQKESDFFNVIADIKKQCIIFSKSFLTEKGLLDTSKTDSLQCAIYRMEKNKPFDKHDLSTIQTIITPVK
jgi:DNA sulfur modification protein DndD